MPDKFVISSALLEAAKATLANRPQVYWLVGGAGSGKSTICQALGNQFNLPIYDMDAHIYGDYHGRFSPTRHPINSQWAAALNGLAWLLEMSWAEFDAFNQAAVPEYLDLLAEDLEKLPPDDGLLIDGGIVNTAVAARAFPASQMVCLSRPGLSSRDVWQETPARLEMKAMFDYLPEPETMWQKFLEFDAKISQTILQESQTANIPICVRSETDSVALLANRIAQTLKLCP
ncbi:MAG: hypothetical protein H6653_01575 [Ardenticatenaceae bacterium]|nr:hypothetical protein [Ardenticatenaceae bacterium]